MKFSRSSSLYGLALLFAAVSSHAATLSGVVKDSSGKPIVDVQVAVRSLRVSAKTDANGAYKMENLAPAKYAVEFVSVEYPSIVKDADVSAGDAALDVIETGSPLALTPITISASPKAKSTLTTPASVSVLEGRELEKKKSQSVVSEIQNEPGVNMIGEGPTVVKPIIRGLSSQDIVVVEDGVRSEALQWGNEHAPEIDALGSSRVEVMRGPNSLMYGSDALGGVISISRPDLPDAKLGAGPLSGRFAVEAASVNREIGQNTQLAGASGDWGWRTSFGQRQAGNFMTPQAGAIPNTGNSEVNGEGAIIVRKDWGDASVSYGRFDKRVELQNPSASYPAPFDDQEYQVLQHDHGSVRANIIAGWGRLETITGYDRANRSEYAGPSLDPEPHLHWIQNNYTEDLRAHLAPRGPFEGTIGVSGLSRQESVYGDTHLTPGYTEGDMGGYIHEEATFGKFTVSGGVRGDASHFAVDADNQIGIDPSYGINSPHPVAKQSLNYSAVTGALGGVYHITEPLAVAVNLGRGFRNPVPFELFAYGVHEGSGQFEIGNPNLQPETSLNTDASVRWASDRLKGEFGVFRNYIHNYIYGTYLGIIEPTTGLPEVTETQTNATIQGFDYAVTGAATDWLNLSSGGNLVRGYNDNYADATLASHNLPHVPADNVRFGAELHRRAWGDVKNPYFSVEEKLFQRQNRTGPEEIGAPGYALLNVKTGGELVVMGNRMSVDLGVDNLLNKGYIDFNSILKEFNIQNPGRNVWARVTVPFGS